MESTRPVSKVKDSNEKKGKLNSWAICLKKSLPVYVTIVEVNYH